MTTTEPPPAATPDDLDERPTGELLRAVVDTAQALARKELELARLELKAIATARLAAAALAVVAATVVLFVLAFAGVTVAKALELVWPAWLAWLVVTLGYTLVVAGLLALAYWFATRPPNSPERARAAAEETVAWARARAAPYTVAATGGEDAGGRTHDEGAP